MAGNTRKIAQDCATSGPSETSPEGGNGVRAAQNIASQAGEVAAASAIKAGAIDDTAKDIGNASAEAAGQRALQEAANSKMPRLKGFNFKLRENQFLKGKDCSRTYFNMFDAAKEAAGWIPGTPIHPEDDRLLGWEVMRTSTGEPSLLWRNIGWLLKPYTVGRFASGPGARDKSVASQMLFQEGVGNLGLPIGLGVVRSRQQCSNPKAFTQVFPEFGHKLGSSVGHDSSRQAVQFPDMLNVQTGNLFRITGSLAVDEVLHLGQAVNYSQDSVVAVAVA